MDYYYYYYAAFNMPCVGHKDDKSQAQDFAVHYGVITNGCQYFVLCD